MAKPLSSVHTGVAVMQFLAVEFPSPRPTYCCNLASGLPGGSTHLDFTLDGRTWSHLERFCRLRVSGLRDGGGTQSPTPADSGSPSAQRCLPLPDARESVAIVPNSRGQLFFEIHFPRNCEIVDIKSYAWHVPATCPLPSWLNLSWTAYLGCHVEGSKPAKPTPTMHVDLHNEAQDDYHVRDPPYLDASAMAEVYGEQREVPSERLVV